MIEEGFVLTPKLEANLKPNCTSRPSSYCCGWGSMAEQAVVAAYFLTYYTSRRCCICTAADCIMATWAGVAAAAVGRSFSSSCWCGGRSLGETWFAVGAAGGGGDVRDGHGMMRRGLAKAIVLKKDMEQTGKCPWRGWGVLFFCRWQPPCDYCAAYNMLQLIQGV
jgi:hypothetical protein